ncbi:MAG: hypothetical protein ACK49D_02770, partial [Flavobacteriia bacterium]
FEEIITSAKNVLALCPLSFSAAVSCLLIKNLIPAGIWNLIAAQIRGNHYISEECTSPLSIVFQRSGLLSFN